MPVIPEMENRVKPTAVKRVVLSTGKVFYDLWETREEAHKYDVALIRVEELYPFPHDDLVAILKTYKNAEEIIWCQEEPENMGAWFFMDRRLERVMHDAGHKGKRPIYVGRGEAASPATGFAQLHLKEQKELVEQALNLNTVMILKKGKK